MLKVEYKGVISKAASRFGWESSHPKAEGANYTNGNLEHQTKAFDYLESVLTDVEIENFLKLFRVNDSIPKYKISLSNFPLISQRDFVGDGDGDGTADKWQTCNIHCCHMVIKYLTGKTISPVELDRTVRTKFGSRYVHANLVKLLALYGVKSVFDVSTSHAEIKAHLKQNKPIIWSNKLTHGGHLVCITGFDDDNLYYEIADPYGEPSPVTKDRTKWNYQDSRRIYKLSYQSFDIVNANGFNYGKKEHWTHLCSKI